MTLTLSLVLLAFVLVACGGGGDDPAPRTLQVFGDSTMEQQQELMAARGVAVIGSAVSGTTSTMLLTGTDGVNAPWPAPVRGSVVIVNHGLNDSQDTFGPPYGITIDAYKANLRRLAQAPGALVIFQTPNPAWRADRAPAAYALAMREVAAELRVPLIDVHAFVMARADWREWLPDGLHPSPFALARIVDECVMPALRAHITL